MKSLITHSPRCEQKRLPAINTARTEEHAQLDEQTRHTSLHDSTHTAHRALIAKAVTGSCYLRPVWRVAHRVAAEGFPAGFPNEAPEAQAADTLRRQSAPSSRGATACRPTTTQRHEGVQEQNAALRDARRAAHPVELVRVAVVARGRRAGGGEVRRSGAPQASTSLECTLSTLKGVHVGRALRQEIVGGGDPRC